MKFNELKIECICEKFLLKYLLKHYKGNKKGKYCYVKAIQTLAESVLSIEAANAVRPVVVNYDGPQL